MLRGNHDDPEYFDKGLIDFPLMKTIPDYTVIHFQKRRILCVGGGISVDRFLRKQRMSNKDVKLYLDGEAPNFDLSKLEMISSEIRIDTVITHTAPSFCFPIPKQETKDMVGYRCQPRK
ncbi:MAG: hypothetical protein LIP06_07850 [Tannerellaceae bacterium]|nr:hypothetical protein [Odoribacter sp.]MCC8198472.1 hypothetical protein [Tannerellaceae bacterium]